MCSTKFILFASIGLCILASTVVFGQFDGEFSQQNRHHFREGRTRDGSLRGHGFGRGFGYLKGANLTEEQREKLGIILQNNNVTKQEKQESLQAFFEEVGGDALTRFNAKQAKIEAHKAQISNWTANANLSDAAKSFFSEIQAIHDNMQITKAQEREQIKALFEGASDEIKEELKSLHHGGGRRGRFNQNRYGGEQQQRFNGRGFHGRHGGRGGHPQTVTTAPVENEEK